MNFKTLTMLTLGLGLSAAVSAQDIRTELNGRPLQFDQPAMMSQGRVLVPLRGIFEALGADVVYDPARRSVKATKDNQVVELTLGSRQALINGQSNYLDVPANSVNGRVLVPLRFVSEALGADVRWMAGTRTVALTSTGGDVTVNEPVQNNPEPQPATNGPNINSIIHNGRSALNIGDRLVVTMTGDPGGQASFDILGVVDSVPMREVFPGRYEGEITVNSGMQVNNGTLVGHLRLNGRESSKEGRRDVSITNNYMGGVNPNGQFGDVFPQPNSQIGDLRPTIEVNLTNAVRPQSVRVLLDGNDVTGQTQITSNSIRFVPNYNLTPGQHRVSVHARELGGRILNRDWSFTAFNNGAANPYNPGAVIPTIALTNISNGASVPAVFSVQGQTKPFATVQVQAEARRDLIPGWISLQNFSRTNTAQADAWGRFSVPIDSTQVPAGTPITLRIQANDQEGRTSQQSILQVTRR